MARDVPLKYKGIDVTDIDIWLYMKASSISRERTCVDIKNRKTPQAMERVLWTKGMMEILNSERAIVVTSDNRKVIRDYGIASNITVLHGEFVQKILRSYSLSSRISEEDMKIMFDEPCLIDARINWHKFYRDAKSALIEKLDFSGCNEYLKSISIVLQEYLASDKKSILSIRLVYELAAFFLISLDYASRFLAHLDNEERKKGLENGMRYGEVGQKRTEEILDMAIGVLAESGKADLFSPSEVREVYKKQMLDYPADILAEYFSKSSNMKLLFEAARKYDELAYSEVVTYPHQLSPELKAILGLLCDFFKLDRKSIL